MKKTKRYNAQGYVTNDDSNSGMKEAYDADQLAENFDDYGSKKGAGAAGTSESTTEEAGGAMLKAMRDKASAPKPKAKAKPLRPVTSGNWWICIQRAMLPMLVSHRLPHTATQAGWYALC